jgi:hypothetical protein
VLIWNDSQDAVFLEKSKIQDGHPRCFSGEHARTRVHMCARVCFQEGGKTGPSAGGHPDVSGENGDLAVGHPGRAGQVEVAWRFLSAISVQWNALAAPQSTVSARRFGHALKIGDSPLGHRDFSEGLGTVSAGMSKKVLKQRAPGRNLGPQGWRGGRRLQPSSLGADTLSSCFIGRTSTKVQL